MALAASRQRSGRAAACPTGPRRGGREAVTGRVYFIGAGPGDPELLTLKGRRLIGEADLVIYADSLVHPGICAFARPGAEVLGSSGLTLEEVWERMRAACEAGQNV